MRSRKSEFKFVARGFNEVLVLIPGWATDYRVFSGLDLDYDYLFPTQLNPFDFKAGLQDHLASASIEKVSLFGWSLGGFLAAEFALSNPGRIDSLHLIGVRKRYDSGALSEIKARLRKNKDAYLHRFYQNCFAGCPDNGGFSRFKENTRLEDLILGLEYLAEAEMRPESLKPLKKVRVYYGGRDKISPLQEILELKSEASRLGLANIDFIFFPELGHAPFLSPAFRERFQDG